MRMIFEALYFLHRAIRGYRLAKNGGYYAGKIIKDGECICVVRIFRGRDAWLEDQKHCELLAKAEEMEAK